VGIGAVIRGRSIRVGWVSKGRLHNRSYPVRPLRKTEMTILIEWSISNRYDTGLHREYRLALKRQHLSATSSKKERPSATFLPGHCFNNFS
jgi:hypothetical protein